MRKYIVKFNVVGNTYSTIDGVMEYEAMLVSANTPADAFDTVKYRFSIHFPHDQLHLVEALELTHCKRVHC